jgi:hypothetical protein
MLKRRISYDIFLKISSIRPTKGKRKFSTCGCLVACYCIIRAVWLKKYSSGFEHDNLMSPVIMMQIHELEGSTLLTEH